MQKNAIIAIVLTFLVIVLWSLIRSKYFSQKVPMPPASEVSKEEAPQKAIEAQAIKTPKGKVVPSALKAIPKKDISIETENYWAVLTSDGAKLKEFKFKKYLDRVEQSGITIKLTDLVNGVFGKRAENPKKPEPLNLVNTDDKEGFPLGLVINSNPSLSSGNWEMDKDHLRLKSPGEKGEVSFSKTLDNGLEIVKRYGFKSAQDTIDLSIEVQNLTSKEISTQVGLEWIGKVEIKKYIKEDDKDFGLSYAFMKDNKVEVKGLAGRPASRCVPGCGAKRTTIEPFDFINKGRIRWFSFEGEYFAALMGPPPPEWT
jgi:YidC/Oxa1 family membrane protein insertase